MALVVFVVSLFGMLFLGVPIFMSIGASGLILYAYGMGDMEPILLVQRMFSGLNSFTLLAIPLFMLAGEIMNRGALSKKMVRFANCLLGWVHGGLGFTVAISCMFIAAILGSASAAAAMIGAIMIPEMVNRGYSKDFTCALTAAAGSIGPIIPPSIPMIIYGVIANVSIVELFSAGYVPGILMGVMFMIYSYFFARKHGYPAEPKPTPKEVWTAFKVAAPTLLLPILIMGTILTGICTPTESAVLAVVYALFLSCVVYRTLPLRELKETFVNSAKSAAMVLVVIATASLLSWAVTVMNIPQMMADFVYSITDSPAVFLVIVNVLLVIAGMFLDAGSAIMILSPVLLPIALSLQIDPLAFGIIMVVNLSIGVLTPPVGLNLYVVSSLSNLDIMRVAKACMPFILMIFAMLIVSSWSISSAWPRWALSSPEWRMKRGSCCRTPTETSRQSSAA